MKTAITLLLLIGLAVGGVWAYQSRSPAASLVFRTVPVERGDLLVTISATGTVQPEEVVDVGAQVAGKIEVFGTDANGKEIDYGTHVEEGTVLARIDDSLYSADVEQARAQVEQAKANVRRAEADLQQIKSRLNQAERNWKRAQELGPSRALSATDYDAYQAEYETAVANVGVGEAALDQARKGVLQAEAASKRSERNLTYCTIRSPVKGVIIDRRVNIGQTVVSSLNAPSLFLIAKDLKRLEIWAAVNEADIGNIHPGQSVRFSVYSFPGETFRGVVGKVRLNASMTQNVVTYTVEILTDNPDGRLLPYLTATVLFEVTQRTNILMVPTSALRWRPPQALIVPDARADDPRGKPATPASSQASGKGESKTRMGTVWLQDGNFVRPLPVLVGSTDGNMTEIEGDGLADDLAIVIGQIERNADEGSTSPFAPRMFSSRSGMTQSNRQN